MNGHNGTSGILVYYCRNAADEDGHASAIEKLAGRENVALHPVPCSGKIDARYLMRAFEDGAQAVCVLACPSGHCKLIEGNLRVIRRTHAVQEMLSEAGLDPESVRVFMPNGAGAEGAVNEIAEYINSRQSSVQELAAWRA